MKKLEKFLSYLLLQIFYGMFKYIFQVANRLEVRGKENLPLRPWGVFSLSNHLTYIDTHPLDAVMVSAKPKSLGIFFDAKLVPYSVPDYANFYWNKFFAYAMKLLKNISVKRKSAGMKRTDLNGAEDFINNCCEILNENKLHIFKEGGRTKPDGVTRPCIRSVAKIILKKHEEKFDLIVIPIFIDGMLGILPRKDKQKFWKAFFRFGHRITIVIGKPIDFSDIIEASLPEGRKLHLIRKRVDDSILALKP